jgi:hypothetical protein
MSEEKMQKYLGIFWVGTVSIGLSSNSKNNGHVWPN